MTENFNQVGKKWFTLSKVEKLEYVLTDEDWAQLERELTSHDKNKDTKLQYKEIEASLTEFIDDASLVKFYRTCDSDKSKFIDLSEYGILSRIIRYPWT